MKIRVLILPFLLILVSISLQAQEGIDYNHKILIKTLEKHGGPNKITISEIDMPDSMTTHNQINGKYFSLIGDSSHLFRYLYVGRVVSCKAGGCSVIGTNTNNENPEFFDYFMLFDADLVVQEVRVFNYQATHGQEITARGWLKQFKGYNANETWMVNKNIDAISGATISVNAITLDIIEKTHLLQQVTADL